MHASSLFPFLRSVIGTSLVQRDRRDQNPKKLMDPVRCSGVGSPTQQGGHQMMRSNIVMAGLVMAALGATAGPGDAAMMSPFRAMAGSWSGGGTLSMANGEQERLHCRASYDVGGTGNELN